MAGRALLRLEPAKVNAGFSMYHRHRVLDCYRPSTVPNCTCRARRARRGHDRNEHRWLRGRKDQTASPRRFAPPKQMLRCDVVPSRNFRHDYARLIGFRDYLALDLIAPPAPTANPGANINAAASLRSVNYMVNHICEPIQSRRATLPDQIERCKMGTEHYRAPLTIQWQRRILVRWEYYPQNFLGFVQLACLVILFRRF